MPRLFTGLRVPAPVARAFTMVQGGLSGARWIEQEDYHVTLRFIGDVDVMTAEEVHSALERIRRPSLTISMSGIDVFGGAKPRAIIAAVKQSPSLTELQTEQERLMRRLGLPAETRKYTPHVTLARLRHASPSAVAAFLTGRGFLPTQDFVVDHFALFSARDSVGGGPYVVEATYPLG